MEEKCCDDCRQKTNLLQTTRWGYLCNDCISKKVDVAYETRKAQPPIIASPAQMNAYIRLTTPIWPDELPLDYRMEV